MLRLLSFFWQHVCHTRLLVNLPTRSFSLSSVREEHDIQDFKFKTISIEYYLLNEFFKYLYHFIFYTTSKDLRRLFKLIIFLDLHQMERRIFKMLRDNLHRSYIIININSIYGYICRRRRCLTLFCIPFSRSVWDIKDRKTAM